MPILTDAELLALLAACKGQSLENRRDEAIIRMFLDTGIRASELICLTIDDVDLGQQMALVVGKGRRARGAVRHQNQRCAPTLFEGAQTASPSG